MSETESAAPPLPYEAGLRAQFGDAITHAVMAVWTPTFTVAADRVSAIATHLKDELGFKLPVLCSAVDWKDRFEVIWHANNLATREVVALKVVLDHADPHVASLTPVWSGMDWHEREQYDLMGIMFEGHPDLRRIMLPDDWEGHPLRKDWTAID